MTRKLTIRTKLAAALAVPLVALTAFAAVQVRTAFDAAEEVTRQADFATAATGPGGIITALGNERNFEAVRSIGFVDAVELPVESIEEAQQQTDASLDDFRAELATLDVEAADGYGPALQQVENQLEALRAEGARLAANPSLDNAAAGSALFGGYTELLTGLFDANGMVALPIDDAELRTGVELLDALARQNEVEGRLVRDGAMAGLLKDRNAALEATRLAGVQQDGEARLRVLADGAYAAPVRSVLDSPGRDTYKATMDAVGRDPLNTNLDAVLASTPRGDDQLSYAQERVAVLVDVRAEQLSATAQATQRNYAIAAVGSVLLAIVLLALTNRWITRPLRRLADQADDIANERLPAAVQTILDTPVGEEIAVPDVESVDVHAGGEVREVADALNQVQDSALELAVDQARLRRNIADAYVNLGRRNQNLIARQLEFISQLEDDASDPEALEQLFKLDHLATRMRRNAESLLVLAGLEPPRTWSAPLSVGDVVRGALGEVEGYQRVRLRHLDDATIDGAVAADVSHVVAELVENALTFSPPDAEVDVFGRSIDGTYTLSIVDCGIGMLPDELERANERLASGSTGAVAPSRYLGHYVVAQLAARHDIAVQLSDSPAGGVTATMTLLPALLAGSVTPPDAPTAVESLAAPVTEPPGGAIDATAAPIVPAAFGDAITPPVSALPRRTAPGAEAPPAPAASTDAPEVRSTVVDEPVDELVDEPVDEPVFAFGAPEPDVADEADEADEADDAAAEAPAEAPAAPEPLSPAKTRMVFGTFESLRAPEQTPAAPVAPAASPWSAASPPTPLEPAVSSPVVPSPVVPSPVVPSPVVPAEAPVAVTAPVAPAPAAVGASAAAPDTTWSEDFIPQRLPKRSRRNSKLQTPWTRQQRVEAAAPAPVAPPVTPVAAPASCEAPTPAPVEPALAAPPPVPAFAPNPSGGLPEVDPAPPAGAPGAVRFGPELPSRSAHDATANGSASPSDGEAPGDIAAEGSEERFAFFAAFRAAAERAREEAGIDTRRVPR